MATLFLDTIRRASRGPALWALLGLGLLAGWAGAGLSILTLGDEHAQTIGIVAETSQAAAVFVTLLVLAGALDGDRRSRFTVAVDCTGPGLHARLVGRWAGAVAAGLGVALALQLVLGVTLGAGLESTMSLKLYSATIGIVLLTAGWGLLLSRLFSGPGIALAGLLAWFLGHLPWGTPGFVTGWAGKALGVLLPGPAVADRLAATAVATGALLLAALAASPSRA